jgi:SNF2 family DNA or RNA helicase
MHVDFSYCTNGKEPLIFYFTGNDSTSGDRIGDAETKCNEEGSHFPLIFIDKSGTKKLPNERFLSLFSIVITTTQRFTNEWKNGSFADELKKENGEIVCSYMVRNPSTRSCSLLRIHWTRLIVDEGHAMGRGKHNSAILFASWISAQRRWVMTGTPTPQTAAQSGLSNIHSLLHFLQHEFFTSRLDGDRVWRNAIVRSWNEGDVASFFRLRALLSMLMMRHTKHDIEELPPPRYIKRCAYLSVQETKAYNTLVCAVQSNLLLTAMKGKKDGRQDSLLHRSQAKYAKEALTNLRLACSGGTRVIPTVTMEAFNETIDLLISHKAQAINITLVENYLHRAAAEEFTSCMNCGIQLNTMLVMPCAHLVCTECVAIDTKSCPVCDLAFDIDDFQLLQPGLNYSWAWNVENAKKKGKNDRDIVSDEAMDAGDVPADGNDLAGPVPIRPGSLPLRRRRKPNDGHKCEYDSTASHGKCLLCLEEHDECVMIASDSQCQRCYRKSEACPDEESKIFYVINKLHSLYLERSVRRSISSDVASSLIGETIVRKEPRRLKVIIFSQFRKILDTMGHRLLRRFGTGCVAEYWGKYRSQELMKFSKSNHCFCMLLGKDGSEGLDLSFVT